MNPKLCKDCAHAVSRYRVPGVAYLLCGHPSITSRVNGEAFLDCFDERLRKDGCGPEGKNFEPHKPKPSLLRRLFGAAALLLLLPLDALSCTELASGNRILREPGCYQLRWSLADPIAIAGSDIRLDLRGHTMGCRRGQGYAVAVLPGSSNVTIENGRIVNCQWGIDAYGWGPVGHNLTLRDLEIRHASVRAIQADGDSVRITRVLVEDTGPAAEPYCLTIGVEVLGDDAVLSDVAVLDTSSRGPRPCEAVGISYTDGAGGVGRNLTVDNAQPLPQHIGVWAGGTSRVRLIRPSVMGAEDAYLHATGARIEVVGQ